MIGLKGPFGSGTGSASERWMLVAEFAGWLKERRIDLHWSWTGDGEICLTAIRGRAVWNGTAANVDDAISLLTLSVDSAWGKCA